MVSLGEHKVAELKAQGVGNIEEGGRFFHVEVPANKKGGVMGAPGRQKRGGGVGYLLLLSGAMRRLRRMRSLPA
jgi:hypothetical protein